MAEDSGGSGQGRPKFSFSQSVRNIFGGGSSKSDTIQRADTVIGAPPIERRRSTITDASTVTTAFQSGDPTKIEAVMKKHEVRSALGSGAQGGSHNFSVQELQGATKDRRDSQGQLREMKTFELHSNPDASAQTFKASFNPMTPKEQGWGGASGQETLNTDQVAFSSQSDPMSITPRLTGCALTEDAFGRDGHVQPFGRRTDDVPESSAQATQRAATTLKAHKDIKDVFGPQEYGRQIGGNHVASNAVTFKDGASGDKTILHQDIFTNSKGEREISVGQQAFGRRYQIGTVTDVGNGGRGTPSPTPTPNDDRSKLQVPLQTFHRNPNKI